MFIQISVRPDGTLSFSKDFIRLALGSACFLAVGLFTAGAGAQVDTPAPSNAPLEGDATEDANEAKHMADPPVGRSVIKLAPSKHVKGGKKIPPLATAGPADITEENYPDRIESFDFQNAEVADVAKAIGRLTNRNFIIDPGVAGKKITIIAPTQVSVPDAYNAFQSALAANGFTVIPSGKFFKIRQAADAKRDSIETYSGAYYPNSDQMITRIIRLKHLSADDVFKNLQRILPSKNGEMTPFPASNSLIMSDYGANVDRVVKIIEQLDKPGFDEQLEVIPIRYAKSKDVSEILGRIINKDPGGPSFQGGFGAPRSARFDRGGAPEDLSLVQSDERTNALIVVGNAAGVEKARQLVKKLDYRLESSEAGGVNVYYVKYGEAEKLAQTLNGVSGGAAAGNQAGAAQPPGLGAARGPSPADRQQIFGGDVRIVSDKNTNSLVVTASKRDYETLLDLLAKLDIQRDQVYVEGVIMELSSDKSRLTDLAYYKFHDDGSGGASAAGRMGFSGKDTLAKVMNPAGDSGAILSFGSGGPLNVTLPGMPGPIVIPSLVAFLNLLQSTTETNILATPQLLTLDNEEAEVEVGQEVPVGVDSATTGATTTVSTQRVKATTKLKVTPFIRPDSDVVRLKVELPIKGLSDIQVKAENLAKNAVATTDRNIKTNIVVHDGDTAVLGGLMRDEDTLSETKVPMLGDLPVLGWLFKASKISRTKLNLLVFLTPRIIRTVDDSHRNLDRKLQQRIEWLKTNFDGRDPYGKAMDELSRTAK